MEHKCTGPQRALKCLPNPYGTPWAWAEALRWQKRTEDRKTAIRRSKRFGFGRVLSNSEFAAWFLEHAPPEKTNVKLLEAMRDGRTSGYTREKALKQLRKFREYSDELPEKQISMLDPNYPRYKCLGGIIGLIRTTLINMVENDIIKDGKVLELAWKMCTHDWEGGTWDENAPVRGHVTTREEINLINETLDAVIPYLEKLAAERPIALGTGAGIR